MMPRQIRSTANFISYDLRPAKQSERRILLDLLKMAGDCGLSISDYRYVGMGANRFYDFILIHKYLGIRDMVSLEHDNVMYERAIFNCPYKFIKVQENSVADFLARDMSNCATIYWFDYDGGLGEDITNDVSSLSTSLNVEDFCFVTVFGGPPSVIESKNAVDRLNWIKENLGDFSGDVTIEDVQNSTFHKAVHKVILSAFKHAFATRRDGIFFPFVQIWYKDSVPMITVGGGMLSSDQIVNFKEKIGKNLPFLSIDSSTLYKINSLHITDRERSLFDRAVTNQRKISAERNQLEKLGFSEKEINAYKDMLRYYPRYVETIV